MRTIYIALLIVAVTMIETSAADDFGSVVLRDPKSKDEIGAINFAKKTADPKKLDVYINIFNLPEDDYVAILHKKDSSASKIGKAFATTDTTTGTRAPLAVFNFKKEASDFKTTITVDSSIPMTASPGDAIIGSYLALYKQTPSGLKVCTKVPTLVATTVADGEITGTSIGTDATIPEPLFLSCDP